MTKQTRSTCPYCGVGCGVIIESDNDVVTGVKGDPDHPANFGRLCTKGTTLALTAQPLRYQQTRAKYPSIDGERSTWDSTLDHCAERFAQTIAKHGPNSVAFYISGQLLTEDYYVFNKLAKGLIGTNNVDTNSRLCMSSAVAGYKQTLGADAPPTCYDDVNHTDCLFIAGSNTAFAHPVLFRRIEDARKLNPAMKVIVVDPRRTDTSAFADLHLAILPGTDVMLFNAMLHVALWEGWVKREYIDAHTQGFDALRDSVRDTNPSLAASVCGVSKEAIIEAARWFATSKATLSLYCQGLNQSSSGTAKNASLINLHLVTQQIGRPGAGPFSLTGQPNAMGGREVGGLANLLSAHRDMANPSHRAEVAKLWGVDDVPSRRGKSAVELFEALKTGEVKAVWIACTNPAQSMPDLASVHEGLRNAEFVVVQEAYANTETTRFAHVLLPATTWAEKEGTVTNSERCITRVNAAIAPFGEARNDWLIAAQFAQKLKAKLAQQESFSAHNISFDYPTAESVWNEHRESTRGRDLDITGLSYQALALQPTQWPFADTAKVAKTRLYEDGIFPTESGKAKLVVTPYRAVTEEITARFPLRLNTGRLRDQWHAMSRTGTLGQLFGHVAEPMIDMAKIDAERRSLKQGDYVLVSSRRGKQILRVNLSEEVRSGQAFIAMHWGSEFLGGKSSLGVNGLTCPDVDPVSLQPELKHAAIRIDAVTLPFQLLAQGFVKPDKVLDVRNELHTLFDEFDFASCVPFTCSDPTRRDEEGVQLRLASEVAVEPARIVALKEKLRDIFEVDVSNLIQYSDPRKASVREACLDGTQLSYCLLIGDQSSEAWLRQLLQAKADVASFGALLMMATLEPPKGFKPQGKVICQCFGITEVKISDALAKLEGTPVEILRSLQGQLACGTSCGSCVPELKKMIGDLSYV
jgi:assimilatory nitrate reductase catalytic subunit